MLSSSNEDYLVHIYRLQAEDKVVNNTTLAYVLQISPASVSEMILKLAKNGYIKNTPYKGFSLTYKGSKIALNLIRKHRLIEVFLKERLNYSWDEVHSDAELLEHVCSDKFIDRMEEYLGNPKFDPHGDPIPDKDGKFIEPKTFSLGKAEKGKRYLVTKVKDVSKEVLKYISTIGINLKTIICVKEILHYDNSLIVEIENKDLLLSNKIAENISVAEI